MDILIKESYTKSQIQDVVRGSFENERASAVIYQIPFRVHVVSNDNEFLRSAIGMKYICGKEVIYTLDNKCLTEKELIDELSSFTTKQNERTGMCIEKKEIEIECTQISSYKIKITVPENLEGDDLEKYIRSNYSAISKADKEIVSERLDFSVLSGKEEEYELC